MRYQGVTGFPVPAETGNFLRRTGKPNREAEQGSRTGKPNREAEQGSRTGKSPSGSRSGRRRCDLGTTSPLKLAVLGSSRFELLQGVPPPEGGRAGREPI